MSMKGILVNSGGKKDSRKCSKLADETGNVYENQEAADFLNDY